MLTIRELKGIAVGRLRDARALLRQSRPDGAVYFCGYAVEVALKVRICKTIGWSDFPATASEFKGLQSFKTHDLDMLLRMSGREAEIRAVHVNAWSTVVQWDPDANEGVAMKSLFEKLSDLAAEIEATRGPLTFFGLVHRVDALDLWDVVASAPWLIQDGTYSPGIIEMSTRVAGVLSPQERMRICAWRSWNFDKAFVIVPRQMAHAS